ncbi:HPr kinase/phosphorylase [Shimia thalassica]|uniref:HPr kinase/phosphorylase n=1 Tax=Shimia thalassica TaxID=1715693 RepID=UPI0026E3F2EB|nr:serine kinase [Shimia thalassica]MDO6481518.1 serine kinase [Shimia thalassica]
MEQGQSLSDLHSDGMQLLHATSVACHGKAVLIQGRSGAGKSALALQLIALGGVLVADDRTQVWQGHTSLMVDAPDRLSGLIEARSVGILRAVPAGPTPLALVVDLDVLETDRLPERHETTLLGQSVPLLRGVSEPHFAPAILQLLAHGREA